MADNTVLPTGAGGDTVRTIDRVSAKTQVVVLDVGGEAGPESLVTASNALPVSGTVTTSPPANASANVAQFGGTNVSTGTGVGGVGIPRVTVSSDSFPATQAVSIAAAVTVSQATAANLNATVAGTVTGNQGTANTAANAWPTKITDGTNTGAVKAASTAAVAADPAQVVAISPNNSVVVTQSSAANLLVAAIPPTLTKGTQGTTGYTVQELKDAGRNQTNYFMAAQVVSTATEALQSLTGYKGGVAVAATTTPAVVTAAKIYRINRITITYVAIATAGAIQVNLRANLSGVVAIGSPLVDSWLVGAAAAVAGVAQTLQVDLPDGIEFAAGTGIGVTVLGIGATGTAAIVGYAKVSVGGFEY